MRVWVVLLASGALAGCGGQDTQPKQTAAPGQVLPGSVSDAMLPYDTASSAPPLEPRTFDEEMQSDAPRPGPGTPRPTEAAEPAPESVPT